VGIDAAQSHLLVRESAGVIHRLTLSGELVHRTPQRFNYSFSREGLDLRVTRDGRVLFPQYYAELRPTFVRRFFLYELDTDGAFVDSLEVPIESDQPYMLKAYVNQGTYRPEPSPSHPGTYGPLGGMGPSSVHSPGSTNSRFGIRTGREPSSNVKPSPYRST
jgi:hypothetical protein